MGNRGVWLDIRLTEENDLTLTMLAAMKSLRPRSVIRFLLDQFDNDDEIIVPIRPINAQVVRSNINVPLRIALLGLELERKYPSTIRPGDGVSVILASILHEVQLEKERAEAQQ